jgi:type I restriction enzyme S subunit
MNVDNQRLGDFMTSRRTKGKEGLPTLSVTLDRGLIRRDSLERKTDTNLKANEHLRVLPGDIAYNMMRMWQGASGLAQTEALVSPAYVVLAPKSNLDPLFAAYLFKTSRMIHYFWAYSYGLTNDRLRLYPNDALKVPVSIPSLTEQRKIADILSTWDRAIETTEALLETARKQKRALMQQLLTGKRRFPEFEGAEWQRVKIGDVVRLSKERFDPRTNHNSRICIELEHIEGETGRRLGSTASKDQSSMKAVFGPGDVLFGKLRPYLRKFLAPDFVGVCSTEIWVLQPKGSELLSAFLYYVVQSDSFMTEAEKSAGSKMPRADWKVVSEYRFSLPQPTEQLRISEVLAAADQEIDRLNSKIEKFRTEKQALMQQLLSGKRRVIVDAE